MRFDCAGASGSRVRPSRKARKNTETAACKPTRFRMTFFNKQVLKITSKGRGGCRKAWKMRSKFDAASRSLFFRKRVPKGSPGGTQMSSFWCLLVAFWLTFSTSAGLQEPPGAPVQCFLECFWIVPALFLDVPGCSLHFAQPESASKSHVLSGSHLIRFIGYRLCRRSLQYSMIWWFDEFHRFSSVFIDLQDLQ